ncbi:MAG: hypothetical protein AAB875_00665 [Patescibacteria group bacterium]
MTEYVARPREIIKTRIGDIDINIDYGTSFGDQHDPHRAKMTTESLWRQVTHGQNVKAEYTNPLGHKAVANYAVPATWALGHALETLPEIITLKGKALSKKGLVNKEGLVKPAIEGNSSLQITPVRLNGKRLVTERANDGDTHKLAIFWMPETQVQQWINAENKYDQLIKEGKVYRPKPQS